MEIEDLAPKPKDFKVKGKYVVRTPTDQLRVRLEKMMEHPEKPVPIPAGRSGSGKSPAEAPTFVRNVMGSSAGAGSGEFHVYRHLRRKEFARQKQIQNVSRREQLDEEFAQKQDANRQLAESKTAKKRAKRLKKKQAQRKNRPAREKTTEAAGDSSGDSEPSDDDADDDADGEPKPTRSEDDDSQPATVAERPEPSAAAEAEAADRPATVAQRPDAEAGDDDDDDGPSEPKRARATSSTGDVTEPSDVQAE